MNKTKRFIVEKEIIKDTKTGIIWQRNLCNYGEMTFNDAVELAKKENKQIPSLKDWKSLNNGNYPTIKILEEIGFININIWYWTLDEYDKSNAWVVVFYNGNDLNGDKTLTYYVTLIEK